MSILIKADKIQVGQMVSLPPKKVHRIEKSGPVVMIGFKINDEKTGYIGYQGDSFLEVHDPESEAPEMPDEAEISPSEFSDRLHTLLSSNLHIYKNALVTAAAATSILYDNDLINIPRLIELTNDLGPYMEEVRRCRVCGCTDDDCSQCIEASGEPCSWVEADLCSRCEDEALENLNDGPR